MSRYSFDVLECTCGFSTKSEEDAIRHVQSQHIRNEEERNNPLRFRDRMLQTISAPAREVSWNR